MSLDIYLKSRQTCPSCGHEFGGSVDSAAIYQSNITHNLVGMAEEAGIYQIVWRPEENGIKSAQQLIAPLEKAISDMKADPPRFEQHNAANGWGLYKHFLLFLEELLVACKENPGCAVEASR